MVFLWQEFSSRYTYCQGGTLISDEFSAYSDFGWAGRHETVNHKKGEFIRGDAVNEPCRIVQFSGEREPTAPITTYLPSICPDTLSEITGRHNSLEEWAPSIR